MVALPLTSGAYSARSIIANAQRCVNLFPEGNPEASNPPSPMTHYPAPGLRSLGTFGVVSQVRGLYTTTTGDLYGACGAGLYYIPSTWIPELVGMLVDRTSQVRMIDNGQSLLVVDGGPIGYSVDLATRNFSGIDAANNSGTNGFVYYGADTVDFLDGFIIGNIPGTPSWWSTAFEALQFDPLAFATKSGSRDNIGALMVLQRNVWLVGEKATELWGDVGGANFPFALQQGPYVQHGVVAKYSLVRAGEGACFLSQDTNGKGVALKAQGYKTERISTFAIEAEWETYPTLADAIGFSFLLGGHLFVCWRFPTANKTWVYDDATLQWHERVTTDSEGKENQWRVNCTAFAYGKVVAGDHSSGQLYEVASLEGTDAGVPIHYRRGFPHIVSELRRVRHNLFRLDIECGNPTQPPPADVDLFYDGGGTSGPPASCSASSTTYSDGIFPAGDYTTSFDAGGMLDDGVGTPIAPSPFNMNLGVGGIVVDAGLRFCLANSSTSILSTVINLTDKNWDLVSGVVSESDFTITVDGVDLDVTQGPGFASAEEYFTSGSHILQITNNVQLTIGPPEGGEDGTYSSDTVTITFSTGGEIQLSGPDGGLTTEDDFQFVLDPRAVSYPVPARTVWLRWSDDRGRTWSNPVARSFGEQGEYLSNLRWTQLGQARDRVYEVFWANPQLTALNRAFIDAVPGKS